MKSKEELYSLKSEVELLNSKLCELSDDELAQVVGGIQLASLRGTRIVGVRQEAACGAVVDQKLSDIID